MKRFIRWIASVFSGTLDAATLVEPAAPKPEPAVWHYSNGQLVPEGDPCDIRVLRARARAIVVSRQTLAVRSGVPVDRLRAIFAGREVATEAELEQISAGLDRISTERKALLDLAARHGLTVGLIY